MKTTAILSAALALVGSGAAAPAADAADAKVPTRGFTLIAARSASPIHLRPIHANGLNLYIGEKTASYCPLKPKSDCPPGKVTGFIGGQGSMSMSTEVPGGQQVYVEKHGAVGFTQAHSAAIPKGATRGGWSLKPVKGQDYAELSHKGGLFACPVKGDNSYQIFAGVKGFKRDDCLGFDALASPHKSPAAWQYT